MITKQVMDGVIDANIVSIAHPHSNLLANYTPRDRDMHATNPEEALFALHHVYENAVKDSKLRDKEPLSKTFIMINEIGWLTSPSGVKTEERFEEDKVKGEILDLISLIAHIGRSLGIHLFIATQRPDAGIIPRDVKDCLTNRFVFKNPLAIVDMMALEESAKFSDSLRNNPGRCIFALANSAARTQKLIQTYKVD